MDSFQISAVFPATPDMVYNDWINGKSHTAMTGGLATIEPAIGSIHTAWDGYITGEILELEDNKRILMTWRTEEFDEEIEDSLVEVLFLNENGGCKVQLNHTQLQDGDGEKYKQGWEDHYFEPMKDFYS